MTARVAIRHIALREAAALRDANSRSRSDAHPGANQLDEYRSDDCFERIRVSIVALYLSSRARPGDIMSVRMLAVGCAAELKHDRLTSRRLAV